MMNKIRHFGFFVSVFALICATASADQYKTFNDLWQDLEKVSMLYERHRYRQAQRQLDAVKTRLNWKNTYGLEYPNSIRNAIKHFDTALKDKLGELKAYPTCSGTIVEINAGASAGTFTVRNAKFDKDFYFDAGLLNPSACSFDVGSKVKVYYETYTADTDRALKIDCH